MFINRWSLLLTFSSGKVCKHFIVHCAFDAVFSSTSENAQQHRSGFVVQHFVLVWFFLSISHGTGCSVAMLLVIAACCPTPFSVSIYFCIFASINHISLFNNNMNS